MPVNLKRFIRDTSWASASLLTVALIQFTLRVFLARYFGAADLGLYTLAFTFYSFGLIFTCFGTDFGLTKHTAEAEGDSTRISQLVTSGITVSLFSGSIMGLILYVTAPYIANYFFKMPELTALIRIVSFAYPFIAVVKATLGYLNGIRRMKIFAFINIFQGILAIVLTTTFALAGYDIKYAVIGLVLPAILTSVVSLFFIRKSLSWPKMSKHSPAIKMLLAFGFFLVLDNGIGAVQTYTDSTLLGYFMTDTDVGLYATAVTLILAVRLPPQALQTITGPMIAGYWSRRDIGGIENLVNRCMKYSAFYAILGAFVLGFLSQNFITLFFGKEFIAAAFPLQILLAGAVFGAIQASIGSALAASAYVKIEFRLTGIAFILNIALNVFLIPRFGITGAAIATSTSVVASGLIKLYFVQRLIKIRIDWMWFVRLLGFSMLIVAGTYGIGRIFNLYICILLALVIMITVMQRYFITREDRRQIKNLLSIPTRN